MPFWDSRLAICNPKAGAGPQPNPNRNQNINHEAHEGHEDAMRDGFDFVLFVSFVVSGFLNMLRIVVRCYGGTVYAWARG